MVVLALAFVAAACGEALGPPITRAGATRSLELTDHREIPALDRSIAAVDLKMIIFDTFGEGSVPLSDADEDLVDQVLDAIPPVDAPYYESAAAAEEWIRTDDAVVGYVDPEGGAWAYPVRILNAHEVVNDELAGQPVLVSYCPLCGSGVVYDRRLGERSLSFSNTSALYQNDLVMVDRETGSYWWQVPGRAIVGELTGAVLTPLVAETTTWDRWSASHPDTLVMTRLPGGYYLRDPSDSYRELADQGITKFPVAEAALSDTRLSAGDTVVVAELDGGFWAWSASTPRSVTDEIAGATVEVTTNGTGGRVTVNGEPVPVRRMMWFAAAAAYPSIMVGS